MKEKEKTENPIQTASDEELRISIFVDPDRRGADRLRKMVERFFEEAGKLEGVPNEILSDLKFISIDYLENLPNRFDSN